MGIVHPRRKRVHVGWFIPATMALLCSDQRCSVDEETFDVIEWCTLFTNCMFVAEGNCVPNSAISRHLDQIGDSPYFFSITKQPHLHIPITNSKQPLNATMVDQTPLIPTESGTGGRKLGHTICGCCCDSKRAVQIFNVISIIFTVIYMIILSTGRYEEHVQDELTDKEVQELINNYPYYMTAYGIGLAVHLLVLCGASMYSRCLVSLGVIYALFELANMIYFGTQNEDINNWIYMYIVSPVIWTSIFVYPHAVFISEVGKGE